MEVLLAFNGLGIGMLGRSQRVREPCRLQTEMLNMPVVPYLPAFMLTKNVVRETTLASK